MKEGKASEAKSGNKGLVILLCVLVVAIVGLVIGIVVPKGGGEEVVIVDEPTEEIEIAETDPEAAAATREFVAGQEAVETEAVELLNQASPDMDGIRQLYAGPYAEFVANGEISYAYSYLMSELNLYYENGYKEAALDLLTSTDLTIYDDTLQWIFCDAVIRLANELNKQSVLSDYVERAVYLEENGNVVLRPEVDHYSEREEK